jgi:catechol 2,3-dioxygenase-like lactoylglutathione lyase family enzyme
MFKKVAFTYYPVTDVARARKFYEETLGLKVWLGREPEGQLVGGLRPAGGGLTNFTKEKRVAYPIHRPK